jgi:creatinine amidohydrolase/Fe(II)-dependent formamide hydrolase-like protein
MAAVRETDRLGVQPSIVGRIRSRDQGKRATEPIDDFLVVPKISGDSFGTPAPAGRQLPPRNVWRQRSRHAALAGSRAGDGRSHGVAVNIGRPQPEEHRSLASDQFAPPPPTLSHTPSQLPPKLLKLMTPGEVAATLSRDPRLILPIGTVERTHSGLPMGASTIVVEHVADALSGEFGVLRAPTAEYGVNADSKRGYPGQATLRKKTLHRMLNDLLTTWECHGINEFVLLTAHGYDPHLEAISTVGTVRARVRVVDLFAVNLSDLVGVRRSDDDRGGVYASLLLYLAPAVVDAANVGPGASAEQGRALYERIRTRVSERIFLAPVPAE